MQPPNHERLAIGVGYRLLQATRDLIRVNVILDNIYLLLTKIIKRLIVLGID